MTPGNHLNSSKYFWWAAPIVFVFNYFWWAFALIIVFAFPILRAFWWLFFPIFLWFPLKVVYLHWLRWDVWYKKQKWIILEMIPPETIIKPFKAMEDVFSRLWGIIDVPNWREQNCEGALPIGAGLWFSFEIVSLGGEIHFYARMPQGFRNTFESALYAHFPELVIKEVDDYTKNVPQDIPNEKYEVLGEDFSFLKPHAYPIKTYSQFFEEKVPTGLVMAEEMRIDPMNSLMEAMAKLNENEQVWFQIICIPVMDSLVPWVSEGKSIASKIARRAGGKKESFLVRETKKIIEPPSSLYPIYGAKEPSKALPPSKTETGELEMVLTPRERETLQAIETKISKPAYLTSIRIIYIAQKDKPHDTGNMRIGRGYLGHFKTTDHNTLFLWGPTRARIHYFLRQRRLYLRERKLFRNYINRFPPLWPEMTADLATPILNIEELATIFHFPVKSLVPSAPKILAKPGGPPPGLPVEE